MRHSPLSWSRVASLSAVALIGWAIRGTSAQGGLVQFNIPANADVVAEGPDNGPISVTHGVDSGCASFLSQSEAWARDGSSTSGHGSGWGDGLPDDGRIGSIQLLPYTGPNVVQRAPPDLTPIFIDNPNGPYSSITVYATVGSNNGRQIVGSDVRVTLHYATGSDTVGTIMVHDWFNDYAGELYLIDGLDRTRYTGSAGPLDYGLHDANDAAIFAIPFDADPSRTLDTITLVNLGSTGILNVFAVAGTEAVPEPGAAFLLGCGGGLMLARRRPRSAV